MDPGWQIGPVRGGLLLVCFAVLLFAQAYFAARSVQGVVVDENGKPVTGAVVRVEDMATLQVRSYITGKAGRYAFSGLSSNVDYKLWVRLHEKTSTTKRLSSLDSNKDREIDFHQPSKA